MSVEMIRPLPKIQNAAKAHGLAIMGAQLHFPEILARFLFLFPIAPKQLLSFT
jgi:hypothetical protein